MTVHRKNNFSILEYMSIAAPSLLFLIDNCKSMVHTYITG